MSVPLAGFTFQAVWLDADGRPESAAVSELLDQIRTLVRERLQDVLTESSITLRSTTTASDLLDYSNGSSRTRSSPSSAMGSR